MSQANIDSLEAERAHKLTNPKRVHFKRGDKFAIRGQIWTVDDDGDHTITDGSWYSLSCPDEVDIEIMSHAELEAAARAGFPVSDRVVAFKPSDVSLTHSFPPLVGTLGKTESENAALIIQRTLVMLGDEWKPVRPKEMGAAIEADLKAKAEPVTALSRNPFFRPDFHGLVRDGFARWLADPSTKNCPIEFTETGIRALASHVPPSRRGTL